MFFLDMRILGTHLDQHLLGHVVWLKSKRQEVARVLIGAQVTAHKPTEIVKPNLATLAGRAVAALVLAGTLATSCLCLGT